MIVSWRHTTFAAAAALLASAGAEAGGGYNGGGHPGGGGEGCCKRGGGAVITTPNIKVGAPSIVVNGPQVGIGGSSFVLNQNLTVNGGSSFLVGGGGAAQTVVIGGGGGGYFGGGSAVSTLPSLEVVGAVTETVVDTIEETILETETRTEIREGLVRIRAVCVDDTGTPHPASPLDGAAEVASGYAGEVYRCMAGTAMQVTLISIGADGADDYASARTLACAKGEALVHQPGGSLICATATRQRDCFERSLLRKWGPLEKLVRVRFEETVTVQVPRTVVREQQRQETRLASHAGGAIVFDGGVGANACYGC